MKRFLANLLSGWRKSRTAGSARALHRRVRLDIENLEQRALLSANPTSCMACHGTGVAEGRSVSTQPISTQMDIMRATGTENAQDADKVIQTTKAEVEGTNRIIGGVGVAVTMPALAPAIEGGLTWWTWDQLFSGIGEVTSGQKQNSVGGQAIQSVAGNGTIGKTLTTVYDSAPPLISLAVNVTNAKPPAAPDFMSNSANADLACARNFVESGDYQGAIDYLKGSIENNNQVAPRCGTPEQIQAANQPLVNEIGRLEGALKNTPSLHNPPTNPWTAPDLATWRGLLGPDKFAEMSRAEFEAAYGKSPPSVNDAPPSPTTNEISLKDLPAPVDDLALETNSACDQPTAAEEAYRNDQQKMQDLLDSDNPEDLEKFLNELKF
jgi:hypothetical protein